MAAPDLSGRLAAALTDLLPAKCTALGLAVSGGSDSTALLYLAHDWARQTGVTLHVATVDHGLRPEAAAEADDVAAKATALNLSHDTLHWSGWDKRGNLQDAARAARYGLLGDWARSRGITAIALGHTRDDNAETVLMGLSRGAGLDGLSGMRPVFTRNGVTFLRPLLDTGRDELRDLLRSRGVTWADDPSNDDPSFLRIKARTAIKALAPLGIDATTLAASARNLRRTRAGLDAVVADFTRRHLRFDRGDIVIAPDAFAAAPDEISRRVLNAALRAVAGADYPPRAAKVMALVKAVPREGTTLHGCLIRTDSAGLRIGREAEAAARAAPVMPGDLWDGRWTVTGPALGQDLTIRATGPDGLSQCPDWRASGLPRASLLASPAVWSGDTLIAAPIAAPDGEWVAKCRDPFTSDGYWR